MMTVAITIPYVQTCDPCRRWIAATIDQAVRDPSVTRSVLQAGKLHCCKEDSEAETPRTLGSDAERALLFATPSSDTNGSEDATLFVYETASRAFDPEGRAAH